MKQLKLREIKLKITQLEVQAGTEPADVHFGGRKTKRAPTFISSVHCEIESFCHSVVSF